MDKNFSLQCLRSSKVYDTKQEAIDALNNVQSSDGSIVLARYKDSTGKIKTLIATNCNLDGISDPDLKATNYTIYDPEPYTLPTASSDTLGGIKIGEGLNIDDSGVVSASGTSIEDIAWDNASNMNNYKDEGIYAIHGIRSNSGDNMPIRNYNANGYISGTLIINKTTADPETGEYIIGQSLILVNKVGEETRQYIRSCIIKSGAETWTAWKELNTIQMFGEKSSGMATDADINAAIYNGQYMGVYTGNSLMPTGSTFVLITINNYAANVSITGNPDLRRITQIFFYTPIFTGSGTPPLSKAIKREGIGNTSISWSPIEDFGSGGVGKVDTNSDGTGEIFNDYTENKAVGPYSHAEGVVTTASGDTSHAEGIGTTASGNNGSHAEGNGTTASGGYGSHAEGYDTTASGNYAHAEGYFTTAQNDSEHAQGKYNKSNTGTSDSQKTIHSIGIGTSESARKNAVEVMTNGDVYVNGIGGYDGKNYASATTLQESINEVNDELYTGTYSTKIDTSGDTLYPTIGWVANKFNSLTAPYTVKEISIKANNSPEGYVANGIMEQNVGYGQLKWFANTFNSLPTNSASYVVDKVTIFLLTPQSDALGTEQKIELGYANISTKIFSSVKEINITDFGQQTFSELNIEVPIGCIFAMRQKKGTLVNFVTNSNIGGSIYDDGDSESSTISFSYSIEYHIVGDLVIELGYANLDTKIFNYVSSIELNNGLNNIEVSVIVPEGNNLFAIRTNRENIIYYKEDESTGSIYDDGASESSTRAFMYNITYETNKGLISKVDELYEWKNNQKNNLDLTWCSLGTSITWYNDNVNYEKFTKGYQDRVLEKINFNNFINKGVNGGTLLQLASSSETIIPYADFYTIEHGINDWGHSSKVGTIDDFVNSNGNSTFYGAYRTIIDYIYSINNKAKIIICTPRKAYGFNGYLPDHWYDIKNGIYLKDYADASKEIAEHCSLILCDFFNESGANQTTLPNLSIDDALHPNDDGYQLMANILIEAIKKQFGL